MYKNNKGITLIALVITIIVMLILVGVTISMAVNGGLFDYAGKAAKETNDALKAEGQLANGGIEVDGEYYNTIEEYLKKDEGPTICPLCEYGYMAEPTRILECDCADDTYHMQWTVTIHYICCCDICGERCLMTEQGDPVEYGTCTNGGDHSFGVKLRTLEEGELQSEETFNKCGEYHYERCPNNCDYGIIK